MKKKINDNLFLHLNWILKKNSKMPEDSAPSTFIVNRWLSMIDKSIATIVNVTLNRWSYKSQLYKDNWFASKFYNICLPKVNKKLLYFKKNINSSKEENDLHLISKSTELSLREINLYNSTLEELNLKIK